MIICPMCRQTTSGFHVEDHEMGYAMVYLSLTQAVDSRIFTDGGPYLFCYESIPTEEIGYALRGKVPAHKTDNFVLCCMIKSCLHRFDPSLQGWRIELHQDRIFVWPARQGWEIAYRSVSC